MNKEDLLKRIEEHVRSIESKNLLISRLNQEIQKTITELNIIIGMKNECEFLLNKMEQENAQPISLDQFKNMIGADSIEVVDMKDVKKDN